MAEQSAYLNRLTWLKDLINRDDRLPDEMSERMRVLAILVAVQETIQFFDEEIKRTNNGIRLFLDEGINYSEWCTPSFWVDNAWMISTDDIVTDRLENAWEQNDKSLINDYTCNELAGYLPKSVNKSYSDSIGREGFFKAMQFLSGPYINTTNLHVAIYNAVIHLTQLLSDLRIALTRERTPQEYEALVDGLLLRYNSDKLAAKTNYQYEQDKIETSEDITREWLTNRQKEAMEEFQTTTFFKAKQRDRASDTLSRICTQRNGYIDFDKNAEIGRFIYKRKLPIATIYEFFVFRHKINLIQQDMRQYVAPVPDNFPTDMDFSASVLEDRLDKRKIYNTLYQLVEKDHLLKAKKHWFIAYKVFSEKHWLKSSTRPAFCNDIQTTFAGICQAKVWKPTQTDLKEVDTYYNNHPTHLWNTMDADAPKTCAEYKHIADTIDSVFDRTFLRQSP